MKPLPSFIYLFATCAAAVTVVGQAAETKPTSRPNIIFILCDDLGYGDVGAFYQNERAAQHNPGVPFFSTPHIDTLARDGVKVQQHYCAAPVCAPSRASLLTGLTQGHANVRDNQFDKALADTHTLGTVLQRAGYATAAIGKWGLQGRAKAGGAETDEAGSAARWPAYPTKRGFDFYFGYVRHKDGHFHYPKEDKREVWENSSEISAGLNLCYTTDLFHGPSQKMDYRSNGSSSAATVLPVSRLRHAARQVAESAVRLSRRRRPPRRPAMDRQTRRDDQYGQREDGCLDASRLRKIDLGRRP